jgi:hypothetical protein
MRVSFATWAPLEEPAKLRRRMSLLSQRIEGLRWSQETGQVAKRESRHGAAGWPKVRHGEYTQETRV